VTAVIVAIGLLKFFPPQIVGEHYVRVVKRYDVYGPIALVFRLVFAPKIRQSMPASFEALEREARRRALVTAA
jgi:hypothetical protein